MKPLHVTLIPEVLGDSVSQILRHGFPGLGPLHHAWCPIFILLYLFTFMIPAWGIKRDGKLALLPMLLGRFPAATNSVLCHGAQRSS